MNVYPDEYSRVLDGKNQELIILGRKLKECNETIAQQQDTIKRYSEDLHNTNIKLNKAELDFKLLKAKRKAK